MAIYYIDSDASLAGLSTLSGDTVMFKSNTTFNASAIPAGMADKSNITIGYYGTGAKPIFSGAVIHLGNTFTQDAPNGVWWIDLGHNRGGCISEDGVMMNYVNWADNVDTPTALQNSLTSMTVGSYLLDAKTNTSNYRMYIKTAGNNPVGKTYIVAETRFGILATTNVKSNLVIRDIDFEYLSVGNAQIGKVTNCVVDNVGGYKMGGNYLMTIGFNVIYYGGGILFEHGTYNATQSNCVTEDVFDSAYSPQVFVDNETIDGVYFLNNTARRCGLAAMEISIASTTIYNSTVKNIEVDGLIVEGMGTGWSGLLANGYGDAIGIMNSASSKNNKITNCDIKNVTVNGAQNIIKTSSTGGLVRYSNIYGTGIVTSLVNELSTTSRDINQYYNVSDSSGHTFAGKTTWFETPGIALPTRTILSR